jgi:hypothetical protein
MSNLPDRPAPSSSGSGLSRKQREDRAYKLTLATGGTGVATIAVLVLSVINSTFFALAFLLALITAGLGYWLKQTLSPPRRR